MDDHKPTLIRITVKEPRGNFHGKVIEGYYRVIDSAVVLTNADGKPLNDERAPVSPDGDPGIIARKLLRRRRSDSPSGFNDKILYPKLKF